MSLQLQLIGRTVLKSSRSGGAWCWYRNYSSASKPTELDSAKYDQESKFDPELLKALGEIGAYGLQAPEELDGSGLNNTEYARMVEVIGVHDLTLGVHLGAHQTPVTDEDGKVKSKLTAFIVERAFGGLTHSEPEKKMGINASNTVTLYLEDCKVPIENVLGEVGDGFKVAVKILNQGRFGMAAAMSGTMRAAIQQSADHVVHRKQFGRTLNEYENIQEKLANMTTRQYVSEAMAFMLSGAMDLGANDFQIEAAMSKIYASEAAWYCVDEAIQIHGGTGFMKHANLERRLRDLRIFRIFEGANDVLRLFVALTGLNYAGKHLNAESKSTGGMVGLAAGQLKRSLGISGEGANLVSLLPSELHESAKLVGQSIDRFGHSSADLLRTYRKEVIDEQFRLIRLADAAIQIYAMTCALSRSAKAVTEHSQMVEHEVRLASLVCIQGSRLVNQYLSQLDRSEDEKMYHAMKSISFDVCNHGGIVYPTPLGY